MNSQPLSSISRSRLLVFALASAVGVTVILVGVALAKSFTVSIAKHASVTNAKGLTSTENIVVTSRGRAVYELSGDSKRHPECMKSNGCFAIWPPVTVSSKRRLTKGPGVKGRLGTWRRNGILQVTLAGHPLYRFSNDRRRDTAIGDGLKSFGGTWHVMEIGARSGTTTSTSPTTTTPGPSTTPTTTTGTSTTPTTTTTTPGPCYYPPCY